MGKHEQNMSCCCCRCLFMGICGLDIPDLLACCIYVFGIAFVKVPFQELGGMDFPSKLRDSFAVRVCGLDVPDLCVVIFLEL